MTTEAGILRSGSFILDVQVPVLEREAHNQASQVTEFAIENGNTFADHVIQLPNAVEVYFEVTNTVQPGIQVGRDGAAAPVINGANRARAVFQAFAKMQRERTPIDLDTEHARYKNMALVGFQPVHQAPFKSAFRAVIRLQQVGRYRAPDAISAAGGRPEGVLAADGTHKTAVSATESGVALAIAAGAQLKRCLAWLAAEAI
jgi:hypothetical protein